MALGICSRDGAKSLDPVPFSDANHALFFDRLKYHRTTGRFCDLSVVVASTTFRAHRVVLASVSPYFDSVLSHDLVAKEKVKAFASSSLQTQINF